MPNSHAPILKTVRIDDNTGSHFDIGAGDTATPPPANNQYGIGIYLQGQPANDANLRPLIASQVWNCVWNDYADFQLLCDDLTAGKCYYDTKDGAKICTERCQLAVMGIASDTFAQVVGMRSDIKQVPIAVAGWVLAYVDKEYPCGTPLTNDENGNLTEMTLEEKVNFPERLIATYKRKEIELQFGLGENKISVNGRHWVKVK